MKWAPLIFFSTLIASHDASAPPGAAHANLEFAHEIEWPDRWHERPHELSLRDENYNFLQEPGVLHGMLSASSNWNYLSVRTSVELHEKL